MATAAARRPEGVWSSRAASQSSGTVSGAATMAPPIDRSRRPAIPTTTGFRYRARMQREMGNGGDLRSADADRRRKARGQDQRQTGTAGLPRSFKVPVQADPPTGG